MKHQNFFIAILALPLVTSNSDFKNNEIEIALEIFKELNINHCVLVVENLQSMILNHKEVYDDNRFIAHVQKEQIRWFLNNAHSFYMRIGFVVNIDVINVLPELFEKNPLKVARFTWLIFANESIGHQLNIPYNCDFLRIELSEKNEYLIKEIYYVKSDGPFVVDFGVRSNISGLILRDEFNEQRKDMRGATIIRGDNTGFKICNDFVIEIKHREMWREYARLLNFSLVVVNDRIYDDSADPTKPDGSPCCIAQHSLNYFPDAVFPTCLMPLYMVVKFESDLGEGWKAYFKPFHDDLWFSTLAFLILSVFALMIIGYFTNTIFYINPFAVFYSFCCQDGIDLNNEKLTTLSSCIAYIMPFIAATVIVPAYSAAILAKLTIQLPSVPFTDLESFERDGTYKLGTLNNTFAIKYFSRSKHPLVSKIYKKLFIDKKEYPNFLGEAINKLCKGKFAFIPYEIPYLEKFSYCKIYKIEKLILHLYCGFRMRLGSPFRSIFNKLVITWYTSGIRHRYDVHIIKKAKDDEKFEPIEFSHVSPILNLISLGIFLAAIILTIEIFIRKRKNEIQAKVFNKRKSFPLCLVIKQN